MSLGTESSPEPKLDCESTLSPVSFCDENSAMQNDRISGHFNRNTVENLLLIIIAIISSCVVNRPQLLGLLSQPGLHGASRVLIVDGVSEANSEIGHVRPSVHPFVDILSVEATDL